MKRKCITIMSDRDCRYYVVPEAKEMQFLAWENSVIGGENDEYTDEKFLDYQNTGEDFLDYQIGSPLATLLLENPYRRFARRRARLRGFRDINDVRERRDN